MLSKSKKRNDLSDWVIHFIHDRDSELLPYQSFTDYGIGIDNPDYPTYFAYDGTPNFLDGETFDSSFILDPDANAFTVLRKIIHNGYIRYGWSFRKTQSGIIPTIYGPKPAVCFTEMPLNNLVKYSSNRNKKKMVTCYGIAFKRSELFSVGARNVIYGLSTAHIESKVGDPYFNKGLRTLSSKCGLPLTEQYRYVYTDLNSEKKVDWTHEREWRWSDISEYYDIPGLPFLLDELHGNFSKIILIVQSTDETTRLLEELKTLYDAGETNMGFPYRLKTLESCSVLSFEALEKAGVDIDNFNLDDLPSLKISHSITKPTPSEAILVLVQEAVKEASDIYFTASKDAHENFFKKDSSGLPVDLCGYANVITHKPNSEITQALLNLNLAYSAGNYYVVSQLHSYPSQSITVHEAGANAAAVYLTEKLKQAFFVNSYLD